MGTLALIALGSNVGDRKAFLDRAVAALAATPGLLVQSVSTYHETAPVGGPGGQGAFLNAAARLDSDLDPFELLRTLRAIEDRAGRVRTVRWGERPLDLDLLIYGCKHLHTPELTIPHPRMAYRRFVLAPLAEIAPTIVELGSGLSVAQLLARIDRRPGYVALDAPAGSHRDELFRKIVAGLQAIGLSESEIGPEVRPDWLNVGVAQTEANLKPAIEAKAARLEPRRWEGLLGDSDWLVSDFCLTARTIWFDENWINPEYVPRVLIYFRRNKYLYELIVCFRQHLLAPTFVVALPGGLIATNSFRGLAPWKTGEILLVPESSDVDAISQEVIAACSASRPS